MRLEDIRKGDIITYRSGRINYVNKPFKYEMWYNEDFKHREWNSYHDMMKIQRYVKFLCFYRLKTIYKRKNNNNSDK